MRTNLCARALALTTAAALSGCAGGTGSVPASNVPAAASLPAGPPSRAALVAGAPASRLMDGTWDGGSGSQCQASADPVALPEPLASSDGTLFVADVATSTVEEFDATGSPTTPLGSLTASLNRPWGLWVDTTGTLYAANWNVSNVVEFPEGVSQNPTVLSSPYILAPISVGVDNKQNIYVVNGRGGPILIFAPGQSTPTQLADFVYPASVGFDSSWNLYVVDQLFGKKNPLGIVYEYPVGSKKRKTLKLKDLSDPMGIAFDGSNNMFISNIGSNTVTEYAPGSTKPSRTIKNGICTPVYIATNSAGDVFVANNTAGTKQLGTVTGYAPGSTTPFVTLTADMHNPIGLAVNPNWQPSKR